jgi:hypothetical protein
MTNQPIAPPPELVQQWASEWMQQQSLNRDNYMATHAARWGWDQREPKIQAAADQELEACCEWVNTWCTSRYLGDAISADVLRAHRRPEPPSLKEQALQELEQLRGDANSMGMGFDAPAIRRALEQLDD